MKIRPNRARHNSIIDSDNEKKKELEVAAETIDDEQKGVLAEIYQTKDSVYEKPADKLEENEDEAVAIDSVTAGVPTVQGVNNGVINVVQSDNNNGDTVSNESDEGIGAEKQTSRDTATSPNSLIGSPESADNSPSSDQEDSQKPTPAEGTDPSSSENLEPFEELGEVIHQIENQIGDKIEHIITEPNNSQDFVANDDIESSEYYFDENFDSNLTEDKLSEEYTLLEDDENLKVIDDIDDVTNRSTEEEETTIGPLIFPSENDRIISMSTR